MKTIQVMANPYCAIDAQGIPQGVCGVPGARGVWIGATLDQPASQVSGKSRFYFPRTRDNRVRVVDVNVADSVVRSTIATALREGALLPANAEAAALAGIAFVKATPEDALLAAALVAEEHLKTLGQNVELQDVPTAPAAVNQDELAAKVTGTKVALTPTLTLDTGKDS